MLQCLLLLQKKQAYILSRQGSHRLTTHLPMLQRSKRTMCTRHRVAHLQQLRVTDDGLAEEPSLLVRLLLV